MSNLIGESMGHYHIIEQLGRDEMATVYKVYDIRLECDVADKVIRREAFSPEEAERMLKRFEREAKALTEFSYANIVNIHNSGQFEGSKYLVFEYVPAGTLKEYAGKPLPYREAAALLLPIARVLEYAHRREVAHRGAKLSNIFITENGELIK